MAINIQASHGLGDITARYLLDEETKRIGLQLVPTEKLEQIVEHRKDLSDTFELKNAAYAPAAWNVDSLVHICCVDDVHGGGFAQGRTMRGSSSDNSVRFVNQSLDNADNGKIIITQCSTDNGLRIAHYLSWKNADLAMRIWTEVKNASDRAITLEMLSSFSLGHISPFDAEDSAGRLRIHRLRTAWSAECMHHSYPAEELGLEPSWSHHGVRCERFGQVGTMPVRGWFPFIAVEDRIEKVIWGAQLAWSGSWQMEAYRRDDYLSISGGLADREFGHWTKILQPGQSLITPQAIVAACCGDFDDLCHCFTSLHHEAADSHPACEADLPIIFNEWCTTWGNPTHDTMIAIADKLKNTSVKYLVIDAGWYCREGGNWGNQNGDWVPSEKQFPHGLEATCKAIRERGLIPGLWFEMETIGIEAHAMERTDMQLMRDGIPITSGHKRFWDMRNPACHEYLEEKVIDLIERCGIGYVKIDYNETAGIGVDGAESLGEGLRQHVEGVHAFFTRMRERLPELVIENCSSGGHRLDPVMVGLTALSSFSDAHEGRDIPIIAENVARMILPRQSQIWAVLHAGDDERRMIYSLAATFLGRMCLSGEIWELSEWQWQIIHSATDLYSQVWPVIKHGKSRRYGSTIRSYRHPKGWQGVVRKSESSDVLLIVVHNFSGQRAPIEIEIDDLAENTPIKSSLKESSTKVSVTRNAVTFSGMNDFSAAVVYIEKVN